MTRSALILALSLLSPAGGLAQSAAEVAVSELFETHKQVCGDAMSNPQMFIDTLPTKFPSGTYGIRSTPDGQLFRVTISREEGRFSIQYSRYVHVTRGHENCATYLSDQSLASDAATNAAAFEAFAQQSVGDSVIMGGNIPQLYPDYETGSDLLSEMSESYEYLMTGVVAGDDHLTVSNVMQGYMSLVTQRELSAK